MKRLRSKNGFTLIECVVAMAVLAIMTIGLLMILNATVRTRNSNTQMEREVDRQVQEIVQGDNVTTEEYKDPIAFKDESGNDVGEIPGSGGGVKADKKFQENEDVDVEVGRLEYDFKNLEASPVPGGNKNNNDGKISQAGNYKVYGAADLAGGIVSINELSVNKTNDPYEVQWKIYFNANSLADERGVKVVLPVGAEKIECTTNSYNCDVHNIAVHTVRIAPSQTGHSEVIYTFLISKDDYDNYGSLSQHFMNKATGANPISVPINTEYDEKGNIVSKEG